MKGKIYVLIGAMLLLFAANSEAAFFVKKHAQRVTTETVSNTTTAAPTTGPEADAPATTTAAQPVHIKRQSYFSRMWHALTAPHKGAIPQLAYIVLAIIPFCGGLAIGLNTDFEGIDWIVCALLYLLFYFPGLIFALIKMGDYY